MEQEQSDEEQTQNEQVAATPAETETTSMPQLSESSQVDTSAEQTSQTETVVAQGDERNFLAPVVLISLIIAGVAVLAIGKSLAR